MACSLRRSPVGPGPKPPSSRRTGSASGRPRNSCSSAGRWRPAVQPWRAFRQAGHWSRAGGASCRSGLGRAAVLAYPPCRQPGISYAGCVIAAFRSLSPATARADLSTRHCARPAVARLFAVVVTADDVDHAKPAPDLYLRACADLAAEPARSVAFEDSRTGIASARAGGLFVVGAPVRPGSTLDADALYGSLADPDLQSWAAACTSPARHASTRCDCQDRQSSGRW